MKILIKNGRVIDPSQGIDKKTDVLVEKGKIAKTGNCAADKETKVIDAAGKIVCPGFIDMHTHLREPGREDKETVETGLRAAVAGGFTTVCAMPNTEPACDTQSQALFLREKAAKLGTGTVIPVGAITKKREGKAISQMSELKDAGCLLVSDDGSGVQDAAVMRRAMEYAAMLGLVVSVHCEEKTLAENGVMNEGYWSTVLGLNGIPREAENIMIDRDIKLAELTKAKLHIAHVSTKEGVEMVRAAKKKGIAVTAEATPHHFTLTDEEVKTYNTNLKVNPPLRTKDDVEAVKKGLKDGTIDVIATDHAPHLESEKEREFDFAPFGMIGLETALALACTELVDDGYLTMKELIQKLAENPAKILGYEKGTLKEGAAADITIFDPEKKWVYEKNKIRSRSANSPFIGRELKGKVTDVIVDGKIVMKEEELV